MCRVTILNENGIPVTVEVSREIYQVFVDYEREIERQRKADFRHRDARSWDTCLIFEVCGSSAAVWLETLNRLGYSQYRGCADGQSCCPDNTVSKIRLKRCCTGLFRCSTSF